MQKRKKGSNRSRFQKYQNMKAVVILVNLDGVLYAEDNLTYIAKTLRFHSVLLTVRRDILMIFNY